MQVLIHQQKVLRNAEVLLSRIGAWRWGRGKQREQQESLWIAHGELTLRPGAVYETEPVAGGGALR